MNNESTENSGQNNTATGAGNESNDAASTLYDNTGENSGQDEGNNAEGTNEGDKSGADGNQNTDEGDKSGEGKGDDSKGEDAKEGDDGKEGDKKGDEKDGVPEKYEFKFEDGVSVDSEILEEFSKFAKEKGLSQKDAQAFADFGPKLAAKIAAANTAAVDAFIAERTEKWGQDMQNDKELGGEKLKENLAIAKRTLDTFGTPELSKLLGKFDEKDNPGGTGFGNHPEVIRFFHKVGTLISEDKFIGGDANNKGGNSPENVLYNNTK